MSQVSTASPLLPGEWLGMIGGGQLGRMFCHAAQSMGYKVAVLDPDEHSPAGAVAEMHICAGYEDPDGLAKLSARCKAITTEFENVPARSLATLAKTSSVSPCAEAVAIVQDRLREKAFIESCGVPVAPHAAIRTADDILNAPSNLFPGILKVTRLGYDGKGQARVKSPEEALIAFSDFGATESVLEALLPLAGEISVVLARGMDGQTVVFPSASNEHREGILAISTLDANAVEPPQGQVAAEAAVAIARALKFVGVMCVEFFILQDGSLVANEIAPRPHNSGHYTMNACVSSQFEQQARAMAGMPLGNPDATVSAVMLNILGDVWFDPASGLKREPDWSGVLAVSGAKLHLYGKAEARMGRKMGHINVVGTTLKQAQGSAAKVAGLLGIAFRP